LCRRDDTNLITCPTGIYSHAKRLSGNSAGSSVHYSTERYSGRPNITNRIDLGICRWLGGQRAHNRWALKLGSVKPSTRMKLGRGRKNGRQRKLEIREQIRAAIDGSLSYLPDSSPVNSLTPVFFSFPGARRRATSSRKCRIDHYIDGMAKITSVITVRPRRAPPILMCRKCVARANGGKNLKRALKSEIKSRSTSSSQKPARIVMTSCFGICPKHAVVVTSGVSLQRGEYLLVGESGAVSDAVALLLPV
jgi:hypothetical protein